MRAKCKQITHLSLSYHAHCMKACNNSTKDDTLTKTILYYTIFHVQQHLIRAERQSLGLLLIELSF